MKRLVLSNGEFVVSDELKQLLYSRGSELVVKKDNELVYIGKDSVSERSDSILLEVVYELSSCGSTPSGPVKLRVVELAMDYSKVEIRRVGAGPEIIYALTSNGVFPATVIRAGIPNYCYSPRDYMLLRNPVYTSLYGDNRYRTLLRDNNSNNRWICEGATQEEADQRFIMLTAELADTEPIAAYALGNITNALAPDNRIALAV